MNTVWTVNCLPSGDIAAGASDGIVRIFTRAEERVADLDTLMVSVTFAHLSNIE